MSAEQNHKTWGVSDFERYHSGKMTEAEMHALEKAALDDPFLEDALDGYAFTKTPVADINHLKEKLFPESVAAEEEDDKTPVVWFRRKAFTQLMKAAAILIIFGGLGYFILNNNKNKEEGTGVTEIAAVKEEGAKPAAENPLYNVSDTTPVIAKLDDNRVAEILKENQVATAPVTIQQAPSNYDINTPAEQDDLRRNANVMKDKEGIVAKPVTPGVNVTRQAPVAAKQDKAIFNQQSQGEIRGRVVDNTGNAVPFATVRNNADSRQQAISADVNGNFSLQNNLPASNAEVEVNASGYETAKTNLTNNTANNTIVLNQSQTGLSEVVVTGVGAKKATAAKEETDYYSNAKGKKVKYHWNGKNSYIQLRNATPLQGWPYFYYVMNDSLITKDNQFEKQKGKVTLEFDVDTAGAVKNVTVKKSLNEVADNAAKVILLKSPVLKTNNKQKKGEAVIKFGL